MDFTSFNFHFLINMIVYCFITLLVTGISFRWLSRQNKFPGICAVIAIISWVISMISFASLGEPELESSETARMFGMITAITANVMLILPPFFNALKNAPNARKERKERRKVAKDIKVEVKKTTRNIFDL